MSHPLTNASASMATAESYTLEQVAPGSTVTLLELQTESSNYRQTLYAMGLLPGTIIRVIRIAPLGDPMQIQVRDSQLTIRKCDAKSLLVAPTEAGHNEQA